MLDLTPVDPLRDIDRRPWWRPPEPGEHVTAAWLLHLLRERHGPTAHVSPTGTWPTRWWAWVPDTDGSWRLLARCYSELEALIAALDCPHPLPPRQWR